MAIRADDEKPADPERMEFKYYAPFDRISISKKLDRALVNDSRINYIEFILGIDGKGDRPSQWHAELTIYLSRRKGVPSILKTPNSNRMELLITPNIPSVISGADKSATTLKGEDSPLSEYEKSPRLDRSSRSFKLHGIPT